MKLSGEIIIDASAERVWAIVGDGFASIGEWATPIAASHRDGASAPRAGAPVAGRICQTGLPGVPRVAETIVAYDGAP